MEDLETVLEGEAEQGMREAFESQVQELLGKEDLYSKNGDSVKVGLETEYAVVDDGFEPIDHVVRDQIIEGLGFADVEVGGSQVEIRTDPITPESLADLEHQMRLPEQDLRDEADARDAKIIRAGTHPFVDFDDVPMSKEEKYQVVPNFHDRHRNGHTVDEFGVEETVDPRNADIAGVINSTQANIEASGFEDAVDKANYTYMISPFMSAISSNARFVDGKDTGFSDVRMPLWEKSHDIRGQDQLGEDVATGKLESYYDSLTDYTGRVKEEPFILNDEEMQEAAMDIGIGTFWKDSRIKFAEDQEEERYDTIVESRVVSTQPTVKEEVAMHGFFIGRIAYAQNEELHGEGGEKLMDIEKVNRNRYSAMHNGLDTKLYDTDGELQDASDVLEQELEKAEEGLEYAGIEDPGYMDMLYNRLEEGTPSDKMAEGFNNARNKGLNRKEALQRGLEYQVEN